MDLTRLFRGGAAALFLVAFAFGCGPASTTDGHDYEKPDPKPTHPEKPLLNLSSYLGISGGAVSDMAIDAHGNIFIVGNVPTIVDDVEVERPFIARIHAWGQMDYIRVLDADFLVELLGETPTPLRIDVRITAIAVEDKTPHIAIDVNDLISRPGCSAAVARLHKDAGGFDWSTCVVYGEPQEPPLLRQGVRISALRVADGLTYVTGNAQTLPPRGTGVAFVEILGPDGEILHQLDYGEMAGVAPLDIATSPVDGSVYLVGQAFEPFGPPPPIPVVNAIQEELSGSHDGFAARFSSDLSEIYFSTFLGSTEWDAATRVHVGPDGRAYVTGFTVTGAGFPLLDPLPEELRGDDSVAFLTVFEPDGRLVYSTTVGGSEPDAGRGVTLALDGTVLVGGTTESLDFPLQNAIFPYAGETDVFVLGIDIEESRLVFSTYLGGGDVDLLAALELDRHGKVLLGGTTASNDFPLVRPFVDELGAEVDGFVARLKLPWTKEEDSDCGEEGKPECDCEQDPSCEKPDEGAHECDAGACDEEDVGGGSSDGEFDPHPGDDELGEIGQPGGNDPDADDSDGAGETDASTDTEDSDAGGINAPDEEIKYASGCSTGGASSAGSIAGFLLLMMGVAVMRRGRRS